MYVRLADQFFEICGRIFFADLKLPKIRKYIISLPHKVRHKMLSLYTQEKILLTNHAADI